MSRRAGDSHPRHCRSSSSTPSIFTLFPVPYPPDPPPLPSARRGGIGAGNETQPTAKARMLVTLQILSDPSETQARQPPAAPPPPPRNTDPRCVLASNFLALFNERSHTRCFWDKGCAGYQPRLGSNLSHLTARPGSPHMQATGADLASTFRAERARFARRSTASHPALLLPSPVDLLRFPQSA